MRAGSDRTRRKASCQLAAMRRVQADHRPAHPNDRLIRNIRNMLTKVARRSVPRKLARLNVRAKWRGAI